MIIKVEKKEEAFINECALIMAPENCYNSRVIYN